MPDRERPLPLVPIKCPKIGPLLTPPPPPPPPPLNLKIMTLIKDNDTLFKVKVISHIPSRVYYIQNTPPPSPPPHPPSLNLLTDKEPEGLAGFMKFNIDNFPL